MSTAKCYWPNGDEIAPSANYSPCPANPISSRDQTHFACCDSSAVCTDQGLCVGGANWFYRGGCTDKKWSSSSCASQCVAHKSNENFDEGGFVNIVACGNGTRASEWCCESAGGGSSSCCAASVDMLLGRPYALVSSDSSSTTAAATSASASSTPTSSSVGGSTAAPAASTSSSLSPPSSDAKSIGLGVGLGLLVLLLIALTSFLIFRERKRRIEAEQKVKSVIGHPEMDNTVSNLQTPGSHLSEAKTELPSYGQAREVPAEHNGIRYEVAG